jgi:hypothetical protein
LLFDAHVRTCALRVERAPVARHGRTARRGGGFEPLRAVEWHGGLAGVLLDDPSPVVPDAAGPVLGDLAPFAVDFRDQYYGLVGAVSDDADGPPLVTSGLIEPGRCLWGERPVRFAKQRYTAPRVASTARRRASASGRTAGWCRRS